MDTEHTRDPLCPHCGHAARDAWEWCDAGDNECGEHECGRCEKTYQWARTVTITWSTQATATPPAVSTQREEILP